ncbi:MAG: efflux RND transporter periplasmic adaptor subunit [Lentisphaeraceae bacterium]|nr:efflux RND transporter periplasmic adaptor subunit [Lentisphaeraceae bacterium]
MIYKLLFILLIISSFTSCKKPVVQRKAPPAPEVLVTTVVTKGLKDSQTIIGKTKAFANVDIQAKVEGYITEVLFKDGGAVKEGQVLIKIDPRPYQALVQEAEAKLLQNKASMIETKSKYERTQTLHKKNAVSDQDLDNAQSAFKAAEAAIEVAKAELSYAKLNLDYTIIKAPMDGRMALGHISKGNYVTPSTGALTNLVSLKPTYVEVDINEKLAMTSMMKNLKEGENLLQIKKDQVWDYNIELSNGVEYKYPGTLDAFDNQVNSTTGTLKVRLKFPNPDFLLSPNQYVNLKISSKTKVPRLIIPQSAVMSDQTGDYIYSVNETNNVVRMPIILGKKIGTSAIVEKGLEGGETIIFQGTQKVRPGALVVPKTVDKPTKKTDSE